MKDKALESKDKKSGGKKDSSKKAEDKFSVEGASSEDGVDDNESSENRPLPAKCQKPNISLQSPGS